MSPSVSSLIAVGLLSSMTSAFVITLNGQTYDSSSTRVRVDDAPCNGIVTVRGTHVGFNFNCSDFGVYDYTLTGAANSQRLVAGPTVILASKVGAFTPAQLSGTSIDRLEARGGDFELRLRTSAGQFRVEADDTPTGENLSLRNSLASTVYTNTLGAGLTYSGQGVFGDGQPAVPQSADPINYHAALVGRDVADSKVTPQTQTETSATYAVASGGTVAHSLG